MVLLVLPLVAPLAAQESTDESIPLRNVRITIRYDTTDNEGKHVVTMRQVVAQERSRARLLIGSRVPIATAKTADGGEQVSPVATYAYQNVGFSAELRAFALADGRISLEAQIESSRVSTESVDSEKPVILTYQQNVQVVLTDGEPLRVTKVDDPERIDGFFELTAEILE
jgi:hypothetical protein